MAIIIDTNVSSLVFPVNIGATRYPILVRWLFSHKNGKLATSECLLNEQKTESVVKRIAELKRAGRYFEVPKSTIESEFRNPILSDCRSNDRCILAIMRVSGVRLVCTDDRSTLMPYFQASKGIITRPGARRYSEDNRTDAGNLIRNYGSKGNNYRAQ